VTGAVVRPLQPEHLREAARLHGESFPQDSWSGASLSYLLHQPGIAGWIAALAEPGPLCGFLLARMAADEGEILTLCISPCYRRRAAASSLMRTALVSLAALGAARLLLEVAEDNAPARALYSRFGFEEVGQRPGYYKRTGAAPVTALLLARPLV